MTKAVDLFRMAQDLQDELSVARMTGGQSAVDALVASPEYQARRQKYYQLKAEQEWIA